MIGSNFKVSQNVILDMFKKEFSKVKRFEISVFDHCNYYPCYKLYAPATILCCSTYYVHRCNENYCFC